MLLDADVEILREDGRGEAEVFASFHQADVLFEQQAFWSPGEIGPLSVEIIALAKEPSEVVLGPERLVRSVEAAEAA